MFDNLIILSNSVGTTGLMKFQLHSAEVLLNLYLTVLHDEMSNICLQFSINFAGCLLIFETYLKGVNLLTSTIYTLGITLKKKKKKK